MGTLIAHNLNGMAMQLTDIQGKLLTVLSVDQSSRKMRDDWLAHEQNAMLWAVNKERGLLGKPPVGLRAIQRVEQQAIGHVDYSSKFALYCAELVLKD